MNPFDPSLYTTQLAPAEPPKPDILINLAKADLLTKHDFRHFVKRVFFTLNPTTPLNWSWHMELLCWYAIRTMPTKINPVKDLNQRIKRLILNVPPRSLKSETFSVAYTCFVQGHCPDEQMLCASYAAKLTQDLHGKARMIMESDWYQRIFPDTRLAKCDQKEWKTTKNGHRQTVSVGGTTTGLGGNILIADDILSADMAKSEAERNTANQWFGASFSTRLSNPRNGVIIIIMQRLHQDDTTGHIIDKDAHGEWLHVRLPIKFEEEQTFRYYDQEITVLPDQLLAPDRWDEKTIESLQLALGPTEFAGQYMQKPVPAGGTIIPIEKFEEHTDADVPPANLAGCITVLTIDTASKTKAQNDFSVLQLWLHTPNMSYLMHMERVKMEYPQLLPFVHQALKDHNPDITLIEDKNAGASLIQDLKAITHHAIYPVNPKDSKIERTTRVSPLIETGKVSIHKHLPYRSDFLMECTYFPNGRNDDMVDAMTQYLDWVRNKKNAPKVRVSLL